MANFSYDFCNVCNVMSVGGEKLKKIPSLVFMILLGAAVDATVVTSCEHFSHVAKVTMMVIVLTDILPLSDTCDQYLHVLVVN